MSSTWIQNNEEPLIKSTIKNEKTDLEGEHSNQSNSSHATSSSPLVDDRQQTSAIDPVYTESTSMKNINIVSLDHSQSEQYVANNGKTRWSLLISVNHRMTMNRITFIFKCIHQIRSSVLYGSDSVLWRRYDRSISTELCTFTARYHSHIIQFAFSISHHLLQFCIRHRYQIFILLRIYPTMK